VKLIVGLGNPGRRYAGTRHNVGFVVVDTIAERHGLEWASAKADALVARWRSADVLLAKPLTFMNNSGYAVAELMRFYKIDLANLLAVVDDANLPLGRLRARGNGSAGGHNGLKSMIGQLGTDGFARLRIGVGRGDARRDLADHVLARFDADEHSEVVASLERATAAVELFVSEGIAAVMNTFNRKAETVNEETKEGEGSPQEDGD